MTKERLRVDFPEASLPPLCAPEAGRAVPQGAQGLRVRTRRGSTTPPCITRATWPGDSPDASTHVRGTECSPASRLWLFTRASDSRKPHLPPSRAPTLVLSGIGTLFQLPDAAGWARPLATPSLPRVKESAAADPGSRSDADLRPLTSGNAGRGGRPPGLPAAAGPPAAFRFAWFPAAATQTDLYSAA